jgi:hypothetical protein
MQNFWKVRLGIAHVLNGTGNRPVSTNSWLCLGFHALWPLRRSADRALSMTSPGEYFIHAVCVSLSSDPWCQLFACASFFTKKWLIEWDITYSLVRCIQLHYGRRFVHPKLLHLNGSFVRNFLPEVQDLSYDKHRLSCELRSKDFVWPRG